MTCNAPSTTVEKELCSIFEAATFPLMKTSMVARAGSMYGAAAGDDDAADDNDRGKLACTDKVMV